MSRHLFARIGVPAVVMAALLTATVASAQPRPLRPAPHLAGPRLMARPAPLAGGHFGGGFAGPSHFLTPPAGGHLGGRHPYDWSSTG
jgi:hypothetical protein